MRKVKKPTKVVRAEVFEGLDIYIGDDELAEKSEPVASVKEVKLSDKISPEDLKMVTKLKL